MVVQGVPIIQHIYIIAPALTQINRLSSRIKQGGQRAVHSAESTEKVSIDILGHIQHRPLGCGEVGQDQDGVTVHQYLGDMEGSTVVLRGNVYGLGAGGKQLLGLLTAAQKVDQPLINADHHRCRTGDEHQRSRNAEHNRFFQVFHGMTFPFFLEKAGQLTLHLLWSRCQLLKHLVKFFWVHSLPPPIVILVFFSREAARNAQLRDFA